MKWNAGTLKQALTKKAEDLPSLVLIYGDDAGAVRQYSKSLSSLVCKDFNDPFLSDRISVEDILENSGALKDAASTLSFGGGVRLVRLEGVNGSLNADVLKKVTESVKHCLSEPVEGSVIVISAPGLDAKKALAKNIEKSKIAAAVRCFHDSARDLSQVVREFFQNTGKTVAPDAMAFLTENLGNDREITLRELEKLDTYAGKDKPIALEHCLASIASAPSVNVFKLCDAIGMRNRKEVDLYLNHMLDEGEDLFLASVLVLRHLKRLLKCKELMLTGLNADKAMMKLAPPVMFGKPEFMRQVNGYPVARLKTLHDKFYNMQLESRAGLIPANLVFERSLLGLGS